MQVDLVFLGLLAAGLVLVTAGTIWMIIKAFRVNIIWGLLVLLVPLFGPLFFLIAHFKKAILPTIVVLIGCGLMASPVYNIYYPPPIQTTAQEEQKTVKNESGEAKTELRITLTGAKREEYAKLWKQDNFAVIQWANADVTDDDVVKLEAMKQLREIDLNSTQITDKTLEVLSELKTLEIVRIANTKATPAGVEKFILSLPKLKELDARGLKVPGKVMRDWKAKDQENRKFLN